MSARAAAGRLLVTVAAMVLCSGELHAQGAGLLDELRSLHERVRVATPSDRRLERGDVDGFASPHLRTGRLEQRSLGRSAEQRPIVLYSAGLGRIRVLLWSQADGTAELGTLVLLDLMNLLTHHAEDPVARHLRRHLTVSVVPMMNPDGAGHGDRRNSQGVEVLLDARRAATPEGRTLLDLLDREGMRSLPVIGLEAVQPASMAAAATVLLAVPAGPPHPESDALRMAAVDAAGTLARGFAAQPQVEVARREADFDARSIPDRTLAAARAGIVVLELPAGDAQQSAPLRRATFIALVAMLHEIATAQALPMHGDAFRALPALQTPPPAPRSVDLLIRGSEVTVPGLPTLHTDVAIVYGRDGVARIDDVGDLLLTATDTIGGRGLIVAFDGEGLPVAGARRRLAVGAPAHFRVDRRTLTQRATILRASGAAPRPTPDYRFPRRARWFVAAHQIAAHHSSFPELMKLTMDELGFNFPHGQRPHPHVRRSGANAQLSAGYTVHGAFAVELAGGHLGRWNAVGYRWPDGYLRLEQRTTFAAAMLSFEYRHLRMATGPARVMADWEWERAGQTRITESGSASVDGLLSELSFALPAGGRFAPEVRLQHRAFPDLFTEGFAEVPALPNRFSRVSLGVGGVLRGRKGG